jgi:hypothetical protein
MAGIRLSPILKTARLQAVIAALDAGPGPAQLRLYTGPAPDGGAAVTTQTLLATLVLQKPAGNIAGDVLTLAPIADVLAVGAGAVAWARLVDSTGAWCADLEVTVTGGSGAVTMDNLTVYPGGTLRTVSATFKEP